MMLGRVLSLFVFQFLICEVGMKIEISSSSIYECPVKAKCVTHMSNLSTREAEAGDSQV